MMRRGFTLIELLVVIAIIAILAAILFPVFARAREKARQSSCLSNLKQLMLGMMQYVQDYDEKFPNTLWGEGNSGVSGSVRWWIAIYPYVRNVQIYECPSNGSTRSVWSNWLSPPFDVSPLRINYGYNELIGNVSGGLKLGNLGFPAETLVMADCTSLWLGGYWNATDRSYLRRVGWARGGYTCGCPPPDTLPDDSYTLHNGGSNLGFADGHCKWMRSTAIRTRSGGGSLRYYDTEWN